jgi:succinyl-diaminopimelate desuccinylase
MSMPSTNRDSVRETFYAEAMQRVSETAEWAADLVRIPSESPLSDTTSVSVAVRGIISKFPATCVEEYTQEEPVRNLVAYCKGEGQGQGKRVVFSGHMDTYPAGDHQSWSVGPFSGSMIGGKLFGRGAADMKGGIAAALAALKLMAEHRELWSGEIVLALAGDEETMGERGSKFLLDTVPRCSGDCVICPDVGVASVLRFGEKGLHWISLEAKGRASHGAHVHKGRNAIDKLLQAISRIKSGLAELPVHAPDAVVRSILEAAHISETLAGKGESEVLRKVTVNISEIGGGTSPNLVPDKAWANLDIRVPAGLDVLDVERKLQEIIAAIGGVSHKVLRSCPANWSDPGGEIFTCLRRAAYVVHGTEAVSNMRVGASDARLFRLYKNIPSVNCGLTPYNLGAPDEYASVREIGELSAILALASLDFLR